MNVLDIRIKYKSETGFLPTLGNDNTHNSTFTDPIYKGPLTQEYAEWLERGNLKLRLQYKRETGNDATWVKIQNNKNVVIYSKEYKNWLEEKYLTLYTLVENLKEQLYEEISKYEFN